MSPATRDQIRVSFLLFLGREPESETAYAGKAGLDAAALIDSHIRSGEFDARVRDAVVGGRPPSGAAFDRPPPPELLSQILTALPLTAETRAALASISGWMSLHRVIFADSGVRALVKAAWGTGVDTFVTQLGVLSSLEPRRLEGEAPNFGPCGRLLLVGALAPVDALKDLLRRHANALPGDEPLASLRADRPVSDGSATRRLIRVADVRTLDAAQAARFAEQPGCRVLILVPHPGDAIREALRFGESQGREQAAAGWVRDWREAVSLRARFPDAVRLIKADALQTRPASALEEMMEWLGLTLDDARRPLDAEPAAPSEGEGELRPLLGSIAHLWSSTPVEELVREFHSLFPPYMLGARLAFADDEAVGCLSVGFSFREPWGRWTDGPCARLSIRHGRTTGMLLVELWASRAFARPGELCDVVVVAGWGEPKLFSLSPEGGRIGFVVMAAETPDPGLLELAILVARPKTPDEPPTDSRALGLGLEAFRVTALLMGD